MDATFQNVLLEALLQVDKEEMMCAESDTLDAALDILYTYRRQDEGKNVLKEEQRTLVNASSWSHDVA